VTFCLRVPELTWITCIQLNERVLLRGYAKAIASSHRILSPSGPSMAKPPGEYTTLGDFVLFHSTITGGSKPVEEELNGTLERMVRLSPI
jgi:hypothetical protein